MKDGTNLLTCGLGDVGLKTHNELSGSDVWKLAGIGWMHINQRAADRHQ